MADKKVFIYDTTLRDGSQSARITFSLEDKLMITKKLDELGVDYIEGGWPMKGVNTKDFEYFTRVKKLKLKNSRIVAFGSTRRAKNSVKNDATLNSLLEAGTKTITIFGKSWGLHVKKVLNTTLEDNLKIIKESVAYLKGHKKEVIFDAEHFFDGYMEDPEYAMKCLRAAEEAGADCICLCETNGGMLVQDMDSITRAVYSEIKTPLGIHTHNDTEMGVANSVIAVHNGFVHVQGTMNGFGERAGNANLVSIIPALQVKMGLQAIPAKSMKKLTEVSHYIYEVANITPDDSQPYVGRNAFTHKAGVHANAMLKESKAYEHMVPEIVGNVRRMPVTDQGGASSLLNKAKEFGMKLEKEQTRDFLVSIKKMEQEGYEFESADASLNLYLKKKTGKFKPFFELEALRVIDEERGGELFSEATIKLKVKDRMEHTAAEGNGPVNSLDKALRKALIKFYPSIKDMHLVDFKVRVIEGAEGTSAKVRVLIESSDRKDVWTTVGVSENVIEASWRALTDSVEYKLLKDRKSV